MTKREIAALICRVLSLTTFLGVLTTAPASLMMAVLTPDSPMAPFGLTMSAKVLIWLGSALPQAFTLVVAWVLWTRAEKIAAKMVTDPEENVTVIVAGAEFYGVVVSAVGLFALVRAVPEVGELIGSLYSKSRQELFIDLNYPALAAPRIVRVAMEVLVGLWLLLGSSSVIRLLSFLRAFGVDEEHRAGRAHVDENG